METVTGYVSHIVYRNSDNGYTVFHIEHDDGEVTCVGSLNYINEGELLEIQGEYVNHNVYGKQLKISHYKVKEPEDIVSIERYLGSGAVKGVGAALAGRIVKKFKEDTFRIIEEEPERLAEIKGISERKAQEIASQLEEKKDMRKAMIYLQKYGISTKLAAKIYQYYGMKVYKVLEENPYQLADNIEGIGFKTADEIASKIGIHTDSDYRIRSGLFYTLQQAVGEGHVYLPQNILLRRANALLGVDLEDIEKYIMDLCIERKTVMKEVDEEIRIYPAHYYYLELNTAKMLNDLDIDCQMPEDMMEKRLKRVEQKEKIELDPMQHRAVIEAIKHGLLILTGGPGTGKTTTINTMIQFFESEGMSILLAAPTGRAAKRMTEATGYEAQTIHRLLEVSGNPEEENSVGGFLRNRENPLETDVIIIDEMSMVDLNLMHALLSAVIPGTRLILVGDADQLPSVGPGAVLKDIIKADVFNVVRLVKIFRQEEAGDIVINAHKINQGIPVAVSTRSKDFPFITRKDAQSVINAMITLVKDKLPAYTDCKTEEVQVLTPTRKGRLGAVNLNTVLQQYLNPASDGKVEKEISGVIYREGDKVMQIKNNYKIGWEIRGYHGIPVETGLGVFNGDMGIIDNINLYLNRMTVRFDDNKYVEYSFKETDEIEHAYAVTVHKSQGSEYPAVVMPVLDGPRLLMNRNILYTAVTRARKCICIVGDENVFYNMIENVNEQKRFTTLDVRIKEAFT